MPHGKQHAQTHVRHANCAPFPCSGKTCDFVYPHPTPVLSLSHPQPTLRGHRFCVSPTCIAIASRIKEQRGQRMLKTARANSTHPPSCESALKREGIVARGGGGGETGWQAERQGWGTTRLQLEAAPIPCHRASPLKSNDAKILSDSLSDSDIAESREGFQPLLLFFLAASTIGLAHPALCNNPCDLSSMDSQSWLMIAAKHNRW